MLSHDSVGPPAALMVPSLAHLGGGEGGLAQFFIEVKRWWVRVHNEPHQFESCILGCAIGSPGMVQNAFGAENSLTLTTVTTNSNLGPVWAGGPPLFSM